MLNCLYVYVLNEMTYTFYLDDVCVSYCFYVYVNKVHVYVKSVHVKTGTFPAPIRRPRTTLTDGEAWVCSSTAEKGWVTR